MKRLLVLTLAAALVVAAALPANASAVARGRWQGLAIGLGTVSVYNLFSHGLFAPVVPRGWMRARQVRCAPRPVIYHVPCPPPAYACPPPADCYPPPERVWVPGHWEQTRQWVPGRWEWR